MSGIRTIHSKNRMGRSRTLSAMRTSRSDFRTGRCDCTHEGRVGGGQQHTWNNALYKLREERKDKIVKYREYFDRLKREDVIWRSTVPLINFHIVEYHYADRVMRQFGMVQHILTPLILLEKLHDLLLRGKDNMEWSRMHVQYVEEWQSRFHCVWTQAACDTPHLSNSLEYMVWYRKHTRR
uniref:Serine/threonine protein phosphatase 7 long form isogeny n=1 Tax=Cajanus cajan TaxID=3821 RepID=A0A151S4C5_CAJCA|nr:Serine/threonine protein phosphatase 7 long form isogeny [Cajanus cajan]